MKKLTTFLTILFLGLSSFAQIGNIENITVQQREDGTGMVDIYYDLVQTGSASYNISVEASFNAGASYSVISADYLSGDLAEVSAATGLHIVWDGLASNPEVYTEEAMIKIVASKIETTVTDIDGNVYEYVVIGNQTWMASNLKTTKYRNGDDIVTGFNNEDWISTNSGAYSVFPYDYVDYNGNGIEGINSEEEMIDAYGILYNFYAIDDQRGLCPTGWHVPTNEDWAELIDFVVSEGYPNDQWDAVNGAANALRAERVDPDAHPRWNNSNNVPIDVFGLAILPAGNRCSFTGSFYSIGESTDCWSSTIENNGGMPQVSTRFFTIYDAMIASNYRQFNFGASVRCVKDNE